MNISYRLMFPKTHFNPSSNLNHEQEIYFVCSHTGKQSLAHIYSLSRVKGNEAHVLYDSEVRS